MVVSEQVELFVLALIGIARGKDLWAGLGGRREALAITSVLAFVRCVIFTAHHAL